MVSLAKNILLTLVSYLLKIANIIRKNPSQSLQIAGPIIILASLGFYIWHLNSTNTKLEKDIIILTRTVTEKDVVIKTHLVTITNWKTRYKALSSNLEISNSRVQKLSQDTATLTSQLARSRNQIQVERDNLSTRLKEIQSADVPKECVAASRWTVEQLDKTIGSWK